MGRWLSNLGYRLSIFMQGRNGVDALNRFLVIAALVLSLLSNLPFMIWLYPISSLLIFWFIFRFLSKNLYKRSRENLKYLKLSDTPKRKINLLKKMFADRKTHRYFKCSCGKYLRVPKGRGKIKIHCSDCNRDIIKRT